MNYNSCWLIHVCESCPFMMLIADYLKLIVDYNLQLFM